MNLVTFTSQSQVRLSTEDIYHWNSKFQKRFSQRFWTVYITLQSIGENEYRMVKPVIQIFIFILSTSWSFWSGNLFLASILHHMTDTDNT